MNQWLLLLFRVISLTSFGFYRIWFASEGGSTVRCIRHDCNFCVVSFFFKGIWSLISVLRTIWACLTLVFRCFHLDDALTCPYFPIFQLGRSGKIDVVINHVWQCHNGLTPLFAFILKGNFTTKLFSLLFVQNICCALFKGIGLSVLLIVCRDFNVLENLLGNFKIFDWLWLHLASWGLLWWRLIGFFCRHRLLLLHKIFCHGWLPLFD